MCQCQRTIVLHSRVHTHDVVRLAEYILLRMRHHVAWGPSISRRHYETLRQICPSEPLSTSSATATATPKFGTDVVPIVLMLGFQGFVKWNLGQLPGAVKASS